MNQADSYHMVGLDRESDYQTALPRFCFRRLPLPVLQVLLLVVGIRWVSAALKLALVLVELVVAGTSTGDNVNRILAG